MSLERSEPFRTHMSAYKHQKSLEMGNFGSDGATNGVPGECGGGGGVTVEECWSLRGSISTPGARRASFLDHSPPVPVFAPTAPNNFEYLLAVSKNLAHPLHPVYDTSKGGGWKWWE